MKHATRIVTAALLAGLIMTSPVMADPPPGKGNPNNSSQGKSGHGQGKGNDNQQDSASDLSVNLVAAGITAIGARNLALSAGSVGYAPLPPGIAKNLARGKPLPPGIAKKIVPGPLLGQLPQHPGYEWHVAGTDLILVAIGTAIVADILRNVFQ